MLTADPFQDLIRRVRLGDTEAAAEVVAHYGPALRRAARIWLVDARMRRVLDSVDICQSVFRSFFLRVSLGQYQLERPEQLINLLLSMARNKLTDQTRREQASCRDNRRVEADGLEPHDLACPKSTPSEQVAWEELFEEFRNRLSEDERQLAEWRARGREWTEIAAQFEASPEALRKKLARAINRVARELGLDESDDA